MIPKLPEQMAVTLETSCADADVAITTLTATEAYEHCERLAEVLIGCVNEGASVSFMAPLPLEKAVSYWKGIAESVARSERLLIVAKQRSTNRVVGTVQVVLNMPDNQSHRADVAKMLVSPDHRRRGAGAQLLQFAEQASRSAGKALLVLDTATGGDAERLYQRLGWTRVGVIPDYALWPDGRVCDTTIFYKRL